MNFKYGHLNQLIRMPGLKICGQTELWLLVWDPSGLDVVIQEGLTTSGLWGGTIPQRVSLWGSCFFLTGYFLYILEWEPLANQWESSPVNSTNLDTRGLFTWLNSRQRNRPPGFRTRWASWSAWVRKGPKEHIPQQTHSVPWGPDSFSFCGH